MSTIEQTAKQALGHHQAGELDQVAGNSRSGPKKSEVDNLAALYFAHRHAEAEAVAQQMIQAWPDHGFGWKVLGTVLVAQLRFAEALPIFRKTLALLPSDAETHNNLGVALRACGQVFEAEGSHRRALELRPDFSEAHGNLGNVLYDLGRLPEAEANYRLALKLRPDLSDALGNLGNVLYDLGRLSEAEASYRHAIELNPNYFEAHFNLGNILRDLGRIDDALASIRRAVEINPDYAIARLSLAIMSLPIAPQSVAESVSAPAEFDRALRNFCDWLGSVPGRSARFSEAVGSKQPFYLAYRDGNHVELLSRYGNLVAQDAGKTQMFTRTQRKRIRFAVVSQHFRRHSVWDIILRGFLVHLDRARFEIVAYHVGNYEDGETIFAKSLAGVWRDFRTVAGLNSWLDAMATDLPEVIMYPEIGMDPVTLSLAARRLAPLQVASWGHPITTGLPTIDLYFSGELLEPPKADAHYRERLVRLPGAGCCTTPFQLTPEKLPELEAALALRQGVRFVITQPPFKFDPVDDALYARIAASVGECTFILVTHGRFPWATERLLARLYRVFSSAGLDPSRHFLVIPRLSLEKFYALLDLCDIYLDCPSFSGFTTAWHAVHRGLPIVTLEGNFMRQRLAAGLLRRIGRTETIAASPEEYVAIATRLAQEWRDPVRRSARRSAIGTAAPLADHDVSVVRAFEQSVIGALAERGHYFQFDAVNDEPSTPSGNGNFG